MAASPHLLSVIKFKYLSAQLTGAEYDIFLSKLWRRVGREHLSQALCAINMHKDWAAYRVDMVVPMCEIVSEIISNRDCHRKSCAASNITNLPSSLVGEIASYLPQKRYIAFSMTNRKIMIDCNSPNRLQKLNLAQIDDHQDYYQIPVERFNHIKVVHFKLARIAKLQIRNGEAFRGCNQLETMIIEGTNSKPQDIDLLINDSSRCFGTVRSLSLSYFIPHMGRYLLSPKKLVQTLSKFKKLEHLKLYGVSISGSFSTSDLQSECPRIAELGMIGYPLPTFSQYLSPKLHTLYINGLSLPNVGDYDLSQLQRFCLRAAVMPKHHSAMFTNKTLREIAWIPTTGSLRQSPHFEAQDVENIVKRILIEQPLLEYLYVFTPQHLESICNGIHGGLFMTKKRHRERMEIALCVDVREISDKEEFLCGISKIIQVLGLCDIEDWLICVDAHCGVRPDRGETFDLDSMGSSLKDYVQFCPGTVMLRKATKNEFIIGNGSIMERHTIWWQRGFFVPYY